MIDQLVNELYGVTIFSKLDRKPGYHRLGIKEHDIEKIIFRTHDGHCHFG